MNNRFALIPAFEPDEKLSFLAEQLSLSGFIVVIVDDGSTEKYAAQFDAAKSFASVISYPLNRGKGYALKEGYRYIADHFSAGTVVTLDCDGQHTVKDVLKVVEKSENHPNALTLGVRSFSENTPLRSRIGNSATRAVFHLSTGAAVSDTQTGLRATGIELLQFLLRIAGDRYEYEMNELLECAEHGIPFQQVPIETVYLNNNRASHFRTFRDSFAVYRRFLDFIASSFAGFLTDYALFGVLTGLLGSDALVIPLCNIVARIISAGVNFAINKHFVFKRRGELAKSSAQYFLLAAGILCGNTVLISFLVNGLGINRMAAKLITEITFFTLSFIGQRFWIFRRREHKDYEKKA